MADRASWDRSMASRSQTQQWTPRRPLYTQRRCLNPKSSEGERKREREREREREIEWEGEREADRQRWVGKDREMERKRGRDLFHTQPYNLQATPSPLFTSESSVHHFDSDGDKLPALVTYVGLLAASPDVIIVCHVNVKDKLLPSRLKVSLLYSVS